MAEYELHTHELEPVYDESSRILILGSFPSVKSRELSFYYGHPQNRFWKVLAAVFNEPTPRTDEEKLRLLHEKHIALWDVIESCEIIGSADSTIRNVEPTNLRRILDAAPIEAIFINGSKAEALFNKYQKKALNLSAVKLPSTSPANASWSLERLTEEWKSKISVIIA